MLEASLWELSHALSLPAVLSAKLPGKFSGYDEVTSTPRTSEANARPAGRRAMRELCELAPGSFGRGSMLIGTLATIALTLVVSFAAVMFVQKWRLERSFRQKWGYSKSDGSNVLIGVTEGLIQEGKDWNAVELTARLIMNDLWMLESEQAKALTIVRKVWERTRDLRRNYTPESVLKLVDDIRGNIGETDAPETKAGLDKMEELAREAYRKNEPFTGAQIIAMRDYFAEIEGRAAKGTV
jgi:hypothetical protein